MFWLNVDNIMSQKQMKFCNQTGINACYISYITGGLLTTAARTVQITTLAVKLTAVGEVPVGSKRQAMALVHLMMALELTIIGSNSGKRNLQETRWF